MGMVVRTNTMALNAYRQLGMNNNAVSKSLEKLSSGFRINRAADDAAGLAISEKMKAQIKGLETASSNAQDGISLLQTAEGNLSEVHNMLNRMVELATKSANGTYTSTERTALQDEVNALLEEVNRISQSANFNGTRLLDGSMGLNGDVFTVGKGTGTVVGGQLTLADNSFGTTALGTAHVNTAGQEQHGGSFSIDLADYEADLTKATGEVSIAFGIKGTEQIIKFDCANDADLKKVWKGEELAEAFIEKGTWVKNGETETNPNAPQDGNTYAAVNKALYKVTQTGTKLTFTYAGATANKDAATEDDPITDEMLAADQKADKTVTIQVLDGAHTFRDPTSGTQVTQTFNANGATDNKASYHGVLDIDPMRKAIAGDRAGIEFDLSKNAALFNEGATLKIDDTVFVFKMKADSALSGDNVIDLSGVRGAGDTPTTAEYAKEAAMILSNKHTGHFEIGDGGSGKIKVDQTVKDFDGGKNIPYTTVDSLKKLFSATNAASDATSVLTVAEDKIKAGDAINIGGTTFKFVSKVTGNSGNTVEILKDDGVDGLVDALEKKGYTVDNNDGTLTISKTGKAAPAIIGGGLTLQIGDTADDFNKMNVSISDMSAKGLGINGLDITSEASASNAIDTIKTAINTVSSTRAGMGALQNRLEYTINNLDVAVENLSAANSRIRDTDMAKEMMNYTKMNVLVQSAQAMLAQANQQPQSVLQLLQ